MIGICVFLVLFVILGFFACLFFPAGFKDFFILDIGLMVRWCADPCCFYEIARLICCEEVGVIMSWGVFRILILMVLSVNRIFPLRVLTAGAISLFLNIVDATAPVLYTPLRDKA